MVERRFSFTPGGIYHIANRGIDGRSLFDDDNDRERFLILLYVCNGTKPVNMARTFDTYSAFSEALSIDRGEPLVDIGAYALTTDGFSLIVREKEETEKEDTNATSAKTSAIGISQFMRKLTTGYAMYYNAKHNRRGVLFEGRFKANPLADGPQLRYMRAATHLAPIQLIEPRWQDEGLEDAERAQQFITSYQYSSFLDHTGGADSDSDAGRTAKGRAQAALINKPAFSEFEEPQNFSDALETWLELHDSYSLPRRRRRSA